MTRSDVQFHGLLEPTSIDISSFGQGLSAKLKPKAIVCQNGSLKSGHYTCVEVGDAGLILHDDRMVRQVSALEAQDYVRNLAYLVFYEVMEIIPQDIAEGPENP